MDPGNTMGFMNLLQKRVPTAYFHLHDALEEPKESYIRKANQNGNCNMELLIQHTLSVIRGECTAVFNLLRNAPEFKMD